MLPRFLKEAGYATGHFGKWHLSNNMIPDSPVPTAYGYDAYGAFNCAGEQMPYYEDADLTIEFIEKSKADGKPFFVNLWVHEPHTPFHSLPKYRWRFRDLEETDNIYASVLSPTVERGRLRNVSRGQVAPTLVAAVQQSGVSAAGRPWLRLLDGNSQ